VFSVQAVAALNLPPVNLNNTAPFKISQGVLDREQPMPARRATSLQE
jgi:hypothetical protein